VKSTAGSGIMNEYADRTVSRHAAERLLEHKPELAVLGIRFLGSEEHPARVVFHFSSDEGHHSIVIEREDWAALGGEALALSAGRRVLSEWRLRKSLETASHGQRHGPVSGRFDAA
jgi:hypothetical protein